MQFSRRRNLVLIYLSILLSILVGVSIVAPSATAQRRGDDRKQQERLSKEQRQEVQALVQLVDALTVGKPAPSDFTIAWHNDFLKAQEGKTYVPFTLTFDPAQTPSPSVAVYLRVAARQPAGAAPASGDEKKQDKKQEGPVYAFEDVYFTQFRSESGQYRVSRAFVVGTGDYDVYVAIREYAEGKRDAKTIKAAVHTQSLTVPNFYTNDLATSTIILADRVEPLTAPLSPEQQAENPYTLGATRITPASDTKFSKQEELAILFLIYNPVLKGNKPDVTVEYSFHQKTPEGEKYFNKTNPQQFNAETLPPQFDLTAGHQLVAGQTVPLMMFPEGEYRLEIKVTDNAAGGKSVTRDVLFAVSGA